MPNLPGLAARRAALTMLDAVLRRGETLEAAASHGAKLDAADQRLALAIAGETLRRLPALDAMIDSRTRQRLPDDAKARMVLRLALAQRLALDVPDHALVATALPLVDGGPRRLVHGVLGALLRGTLDATTSLPGEVEARWGAAWGEDAVASARRLILERPPLDLSFCDQAAADAFPLGRSLAPLHRRLDSAAVAGLPGYDAGEWWVQDLASSLPARLIPAPATRVLDLCAAPGGKTMQLAAAGHRVTALDRSESRLARLRENLGRTGLEAEIVVADALEWAAPEPFDAILLDAPCSATGTFRRHPEVLYRARPAIIAELADLQRRLLDRAATLLRPGASLVYAVCSLEPAEGEDQVRAFLARHADFRLEPADPAVPGLAVGPKGWLRIVPGRLEPEGGLDGFFAAHLVRSS
ncbi:RsmB/NOP family class I SAM-dependent RNA methyltransferase [Sphingomonas mesophila]|uniref:RsmB/NOP family class I SAM-dependent RNA methyltransferase n=1 Tax=Sphingomonas mesophila TaxID=2303576 RepID=UPI001F077FCF|nr:RsmB/NOP family class I SAM-dependent RNA methyltransferase [Sphingomonas mesophila]